MNYDLNRPFGRKNISSYSTLKNILPFISDEKKNLWKGLLAVVSNSSLNLISPYIIGYTIDRYIQHKQYHSVLVFSGLLLGIYIIGAFTSHFQNKIMGGIGLRLLFTLRNAVFNKLQLLPISFFNANRTGDLISRVNNDTERLNGFISHSLIQFMAGTTMMLGSCIFLLILNFKLGIATLIPAIFIFLFTRLTSLWIKNRNALSLQSEGQMSAEISESLNNFRVIVAFNRRDYFRDRFASVNEKSKSNGIRAGLANGVFLPVYTWFSNVAQLITLTFGIYLVSQGQFSIGLLVGYLIYTTHFYFASKILASQWSNYQVTIASWERITQILSLDTNQNMIESIKAESSMSILEFINVHFGYQNGIEILHNISLKLERGKTYAFVGPTGGGKTTLASLIARLYDPTRGSIWLDGKDIRTYTIEERSQKIGFILQEPFLFTGTVKENILYGNSQYYNCSHEQLKEVLQEANLYELLTSFNEGLDTPVSLTADNISLGQRQLIAFIRAVLRKPQLIILDEATANVDINTERLLEEILKKLPETTTRILIAHRLNTIENADEIYFVNSGEVIPTGSFSEAVDILLKSKRVS